MRGGFDLLGDVHGMLRTFEAMLAELGYRKNRGRWTHPDDRTLVSVGDLLDRGPDPLGCLERMAAMVDDGRARMVLGNHELNAVHFMHGLREPNEKHKKQFRTTYRQIQAEPARWGPAERFIESCPTRLELPGRLRVIHACWSEPHIDELPEHVDTHELRRRTAKGGDFEDAIENCIKGPEEPCKPFKDKDGHVRHRRRVAWWRTYPADGPFIAFGHYWFPWRDGGSPRAPELLGPGQNAVCLDWSAGEGGDLVALRYPEREFVCMPCRDEIAD
jgi:hypothetical protein